MHIAGCVVAVSVCASLFVLGPAHAQTPSSAPRTVVVVPIPGEAEILARIAAQEAELATLDPVAAASRDAFERRLALADGYFHDGDVANARRHLAAIRALAPADADGGGRLARAILLEAQAAVRAGEPPENLPALAASLAAPCSVGDSLMADIRPLAFGIAHLASGWRGVDDAAELLLLDAAALCMHPVTGDGPGDPTLVTDLARLRLGVDRPDAEYRALLPGLARTVDFGSRSDDYGFVAESGRQGDLDFTLGQAGLFLDTAWRVHSGERSNFAAGRRIALPLTDLGLDDPFVVAQTIYTTPASAALRRRAARARAVYERNARAVALIDEQGRLVADHRLRLLGLAADQQGQPIDFATRHIIAGPPPQRVYDITRELGQLGNAMQARRYGALNVDSLLHDGEAILLIVPTPRATHAFLIRRFMPYLWARSTLTDAGIGELSRQIRFHVGADVAPTPAELAQWSGEGFARDAAHRLYTELVAPFASEIGALDHLVVIAPGPLEGLPFSLLVTQPPTGNSFNPAVLRSTRWFGDTVALSRMPTLQAFGLMRREARDRRIIDQVEGRARRRPRGFLGIADPLLSGPDVACGAEALRSGALTRAMPRDFAASASLAASLRSLPRLPCTGPEASAVARASPGRRTLLMRDASIESRFHAAVPGDAAVLMFATHALMPGEVPGVFEPSLVLTPPLAGATAPATSPSTSWVDDGLLSASEIGELAISPDWLILSACNTGDGKGAYGQRSSGGLTPWFFAAGATRILATNWPLLDSAAADITTRAIRNAARGRIGGARALQQAMIAVRSDTARDTTAGASLAHPMIWAAFELHGDGGYDAASH